MLTGRTEYEYYLSHTCALTHTRMSIYYIYSCECRCEKKELLQDIACTTVPQSPTQPLPHAALYSCACACTPAARMLAMCAIDDGTDTCAMPNAARTMFTTTTHQRPHPHAARQMPEHAVLPACMCCVSLAIRMYRGRPPNMGHQQRVYAACVRMYACICFFFNANGAFGFG